jgi:hypothetical protein
MSMALPIAIELPYSSADREPLVLELEHVYVASNQARFRNRVIVKPKIDFSTYTFRAVIDWLKVRLHLVNTTQFQHLQKPISDAYGRKCHVEPVEPGAGGVTGIFDVTFQEPRNARAVLDCLNSVSSRFPCRTIPEVEAMEVSVDAYPNVPSDEARGRLLGVMQRALMSTQDIFESKMRMPRSTARSAENPDATKTKHIIAGKRHPDSDSYPAWLSLPAHQPPSLDGTLYIGARDDQLMIRVMDKVIDRQNRNAGTLDALCDAEKRVRIEVQIGGEWLSAHGVHELNQLAGFSFTKLQKNCFKFMLPTFPDQEADTRSGLNAAKQALGLRDAEIFSRSGILGLQAKDAHRQILERRYRADINGRIRAAGGKPKTWRPGKGVAGSMVAYEELTGHVSRALQKLTEREQRAWGRAVRVSLT